MKEQQQSRKRPASQPKTNAGQKKNEPNIAIQDAYEGRKSLAECKAILNKGERQYTDEEVLKVRNLLYTLGEIDYQFHMKRFQKEAKSS